MDRKKDPSVYIVTPQVSTGKPQGACGTITTAGYIGAYTAYTFKKMYSVTPKTMVYWCTRPI